MVGLDFGKVSHTRHRQYRHFVAQFFRLLKRISHKLHFFAIRDRLDKLYFSNLALAISDEQMIALIGDKSHKLLQQALGQNIKGNQFFISTLLKEAKNRKLKSRVVNWGSKIYDDFQNGNIHAPQEEENFTEDEFKINTKGLDDYYELVKTRQSVRRYHQYKIPPKTIEKIIMCGIEAPSSCNRQSWRFISFTNEVDKAYISKIRNVTFLEKCPAIICVLVNSEVYETNGQGDKRITPIMDGSAAIMNILNACTAAGLGSCWTNFVASVTSENMKLFKRHFKIEDKYIPVSLVAMGYGHSRVRKPLRDSLDKYWLSEF